MRKSSPYDGERARPGSHAPATRQVACDEDPDLVFVDRTERRPSPIEPVGDVSGSSAVVCNHVWDEASPTQVLVQRLETGVEGVSPATADNACTVLGGAMGQEALLRPERCMH